jgi:asparagine synthase (glutamine-hydrolysing)
MCGFVVYLGNDAERGLGFAARGNLLLAHRGPDDEGIYTGEGVAFGHRRLSIVDLTSAAHQPMISPDGRWVIAYNGELYNHHDLRARICREWTFHSRSDTETILAALALNGPAAFEHMVGMWALALWDSKEKRLLLSRDRYGQKPLYWRLADDGILRFASEISPLLEEGERPAMYAPALAEFLATGNYGHLGERTFFRDINSFPPAHWASVQVGDRTVQPRRYWRFPIASNGDRRPYDETARRQFRKTFEEAVSSQLMSDVPLGATLSGGLDSSAVAGCMARLHGDDQIVIFTAQAEGSAFDETRYVKAVEDKWPGRFLIHRIHLGRMSLSEHLAETIRAQEEPFGDPSIAAHGLLMKSAREAGIKVVLGGQGGDELLFGYPFMLHALLSASMRKGSLKWAIREAQSLGTDWRTFLRMAFSAFLPDAERRARLRSRQSRRWWLSDALKGVDHEQSSGLAPTSDVEAIRLETVERLALPHLTHYDDRSGMARSIEGRMPFLDHRLAETVGSLGAEAFVGEGKSKRILRESCGDLIPDEVLQRRDKIGFFTPLGDMLRAESQWVRGFVADDRARSLNLYDCDVVSSRLDGLVGGECASDAAHIVWRALAARLWVETFNVSGLG